jgi:hypothetical protein
MTHADLAQRTEADQVHTLLLVLTCTRFGVSSCIPHIMKRDAPNLPIFGRFEYTYVGEGRLTHPRLLCYDAVYSSRESAQRSER